MGWGSLSRGAGHRAMRASGLAGLKTWGIRMSEAEEGEVGMRGVAKKHQWGRARDRGGKGRRQKQRHLERKRYRY